MITNLERTSEHEMLRTWVTAEAAARERFKGLDQWVDVRLLEKLNASPEAITSDEWEALERGIKGFRGPLLDDLLPLGLTWYRGDLPVADLTHLRFINFPPFVNVASCRMLEHVVSWIEHDRLIPNSDLTQNARRIHATFDPTRMNGRPILVCESTSGPSFLVEGYTRCSVLLLKRQDGSFTNSHVPVILGATPRLREWRWVTFVGETG